MYICIYMYIRICTYAHTFMCVCVCVCASSSPVVCRPSEFPPLFVQNISGLHPIVVPKSVLTNWCKNLSIQYSIFFPLIFILFFS